MLLLSCTLMLFPACDEISKSFDDTFHGRPLEQPELGSNPIRDLLQDNHNYLSEESYWKEAQTAFMNLPEFRNKEVMLYHEVHFYDDGRISLKIQDVDNPGYINEYQYKEKTWGPPQPVRLSQKKVGEIPENSFSLAGFEFSTAHKVWKEFEQRAQQVEGAKPTGHVYFVFRNDDNYSYWYPTRIKGNRESWSIWFDKTGNVAVFKRE